MTKGNLSSNIITIALCFIGTTAAVLYLPQSFGIKINLPMIIILCLSCCIGFTALLSTKIPKLLISLFVVIVTAGIAYVFRYTLVRDFQVVLTALSDAYNATFAWLDMPGVPEVNTASFPESAITTPFFDCTMIFLIISVFQSFLVCYSLIVSRSSALAFIYTFPLFFLSISASEEPPAIALAALLMFWLILVFSAGIRRYSTVLASKITLYSTPFAAALLIIAALILPTSNEGFTKPVISIDMYHKVAQYLNLEDNDEDIISTFPSGFSYNDLNLSNQAERRYSGKVMLKVSGAPGGTLYLRAYSLDIYTRTKWEKSLDIEPAPGLFNAAISCAVYDSDIAAQTITIEHSGDSSEIMFLPYYSVGNDIGYGSIVDSGFLGYMNSTGSSVFSIKSSYIAEYFDFDFNEETAATFENLNATDVYEQFALQRFTTLPEATSLGMLEIAANAGINPAELSRYEITQAVMEYIRGAATYDLDTPKTPSGEDFVLYFLNESKQGYCVHFASAAVCMLRSLGVPARYVEGYAATVRSGDNYTNVYDSDAHAWVEVYFKNFGWVPFEATGASANQASSAQSAPSADTGTSTEPVAPSPVQSAPPEEAAEEPQPGDSSSALWLLLIIPLAAIAIIARRQIILAQRRRKLTKKGAERSAIEVYLQFERFSRYGTKIPENVRILAEKAKYSRLGISQAEADSLLEMLKAETEAILSKLNPFKKAMFHFVYILDHGLEK